MNCAIAYGVATLLLQDEIDLTIRGSISAPQLFSNWRLLGERNDGTSGFDTLFNRATNWTAAALSIGFLLLLLLY